VDAGLLTPSRDRDDPGSDTPRRDTPRRYSLHQTVAAYALARLTESGQRRAMELAHARYYAGLGDAAGDLITSEEELSGLAWLDLEIDQVRRAIDWALSQSDSDGQAALRDLVSPLRNYAITRGLFVEYGDWLEPAIAACRALKDRSGEANVLKAQGDVLSFQAKRDEALEKYERALGLYSAVGARLGEANVLQAQGDVLSFQAKRDEALEKYEGALGLFQAVGDRLGEANVLMAQGNLELQSGEEEKGLALLEEARQLYSHIGARVGLANIGIGLGRYAAAQGNFAYAIECMQPAADFCFEIGHPLGEQLQAEIDGWRAQMEA
ncbi:MAG: tetratricopeptide repeat protein, partial [Caldilineaceae bacterium]